MSKLEVLVSSSSTLPSSAPRAVVALGPRPSVVRPPPLGADRSARGRLSSTTVVHVDPDSGRGRLLRQDLLRDRSVAMESGVREVGRLVSVEPVDDVKLLPRDKLSAGADGDRCGERPCSVTVSEVPSSPSASGVPSCFSPDVDSELRFELEFEFLCVAASSSEEGGPPSAAPARRSRHTIVSRYFIIFRNNFEPYSIGVATAVM